jgi:hypothetical protein
MPDYPLAAILITILLAAAVCIVILALTGNI